MMFIKLILFFQILILAFQLQSFSNQLMQSGVKGDSKSTTTDTTLANEYFVKADKLSKQAKYDSSNFYFEKASVIYEKFQNWGKYVACYNNIARNFEFKGEYEKAFEQLNRALETGLNKLGDKHSEISQSYNFIGNIYLGKSDYDKALEFYNKALSIRLKVLGETNQSVASIYNNIGLVYWNKGYYDKAIEYHNKAIAIRLKVFGEYHSNIAPSYLNIGLVYWSRGEYDKAIEYFNKALSIRIKNFGENHHYIADIYNNIAGVYIRKTDYDKAIEYYNKSLEIAIKVFGEYHFTSAMRYNNIGEIYRSKGDYDKSIEYFNKSLQIGLKVLGENNPDVARNYNNIGTIYSNKGECDKAIENINKSILIRIKIFGEEHSEVASSYNDIGRVYNDKGDYNKAIEYYNKALLIRLKVFGKNHPDIAEGYNNFGSLYFKQNNFEKALSYSQKAIISLIPDFTDTNVYVNPPLKNILSETNLLSSFKLKAHLFDELYLQKTKNIKDLQASFSTYQLISELIGKIKSSYKAEGSKLFLGQKATAYYDNAIQIALELYKITKDKNYIEKAFDFAEKSKANVLLQSITESKAKQFVDIPDSLIEFEKELKADLAFYNKNLAEELEKRKNIDSLKISLLQDKIFKLNQLYDAHIKQLESKYPKYYNLKYQVNTTNIKDVQNKILDKNTAIIEYFTGDSLIHIFTISKINFDLVSIKKDSLFEQWVKLVRIGIINKDYLRYTKYAYILYDKLIKSVENNIKVKNLIIIPDGISGYIPFEALIKKEADTKNKDYSKLSYLINEYEISYSYSATLLFESISKKIDKIENDYIGYAPVFTDESKVGYIAKTYKIFTDETGIDSSRTMLVGGKFIAPIPATKDEIVNIFDLFNRKGKKAKIYTYKQAKEENVKIKDLEKYKYIHFATHGVVNEDKPELSGIILAEDTTSSEDGVLYSGEIYNLNLNADLIVLSACETGLGKVFKGEGIIGLTRAFVYAGARGLLVSLWKVSDISTAKLMVNFYENIIENKSKTESLRNAKLRMIKNNKYASPYYWSPFVLIGK